METVRTPDGMQTPGIRVLDPLTTPLAKKLEEEELVMLFVWWLVEQVQILVRSANQYVSTVLAWHRRWFGIGIGANLEFKRLPQMIDGLCNQKVESPPLQKKRFGVRPQWLSVALKKARHLAADSRKEKFVTLQSCYDACTQSALVGVLRAGDLLSPLSDKKGWNPLRDASRADLTFKAGKGGREFAVIMCRNSKAKGPKRWQKIPVYLPSGGKLLDPCAALKRMIQLDPVEEDKKASTPLFRDPTSKQSLTTAHIRSHIRWLMDLLGLDPTKFGAHSLRIGGGTAYFNAGADELVLKTLGRWSTDVYLVYLENCRDRAMQLADAACNTSVQSMQDCFCTAIDDEACEASKALETD